MFKLIKTTESGVRIGELSTAHGIVKTPFFMPVATQGSVKSTTSEELREIGFPVVLSNTYHLYLRPGEQLIKNLGGLHHFMNWNGPILTDSGGYQVFSLGEKSGVATDVQKKDSKSENWKLINEKSQSLVKITDEGVIFKSYLDGSKHLFTPEKVIDIQLDLGVDILMPLDVCPSGKASKDEVKKACEITLAWARRSKLHFDRRLQITENPTSPRLRGAGSKQSDNKTVDSVLSTDRRPLLHGIIQGGLYPDLRKWHATEMIKLDFDGYSVGGLAVDLETRDMWDIVALMGQILPVDKQRYLMGVGTPDDILRGMERGMDMFDCVLPTRLARHGTVFVRKQKIGDRKQLEYDQINLFNSKYRTDDTVIEEGCGCHACKNNYSKAYISHLLRSREITGARLATLHNLYVYKKITQNVVDA